MDSMTLGAVGVAVTVTEATPVASCTWYELVFGAKLGTSLPLDSVSALSVRSAGGGGGGGGGGDGGGGSCA